MVYFYFQNTVEKEGESGSWITALSIVSVSW